MSKALIVCAAITAYLASDLFLFKGPLNHAIQSLNPDSPQSIAKAIKQGTVASVRGHEISNSQLLRATFERLWLEGKTFGSLSSVEQQAARKAALDELIESEILNFEISRGESRIEVSKSEIDERFARMTQRFETKAKLESAMKSQGIPSENALRQRLEISIREEKWIGSKIGPMSKITDDEAKTWFGKNQKRLEIPERIEARHVFIATLETPAEQAKQKLDGALAALTAKQKDFATLAKELSEDPATKDSGGNLGWMSRQRLPPDFSVPVFALETNQPTLIRTKLGWHLIEVTARKAAEPRAYEDAKPEVVAALETIKRQTAIRELRETLRRSSAGEIRIYDPALARR